MSEKICFSFFWMFVLLMFALAVGAIIDFIVYLVIPHHKIVIFDANLTRFELAAGTTTFLSYSLRFTVSIHNNVWHDKADYHDMEVDCNYNGEQFDSRELGDFMLKPRRTRLFNLSRSGNSTIDLASNEDNAFKRSNETGFFDLEIWLRGKRIFKTSEGDHHVHLSYQCKLRLQLITSQNSTTQDSFKPVKCH